MRVDGNERDLAYRAARLPDERPHGGRQVGRHESREDGACGPPVSWKQVREDEGNGGSVRARVFAGLTRPYALWRSITSRNTMTAIVSLRSSHSSSSYSLTELRLVLWSSVLSREQERGRAAFCPSARVS